MTNSNPDNMKDVLDEVMEYKPSGIIPDMDNHTFNVDEEEEEDGDDNEDVHVSNTGNTCSPRSKSLSLNID
jgi:hypothetical protein